jgi:hypothetical protein
MDARPNQQLISFSLFERIKQPLGGGGDDRIQHPFVQCQMFTVWPCVLYFFSFGFLLGFLFRNPLGTLERPLLSE